VYARVVRTFFCGALEELRCSVIVALAKIGVAELAIRCRVVRLLLHDLLEFGDAFLLMIPRVVMQVGESNLRLQWRQWLRLHFNVVDSSRRWCLEIVKVVTEVFL